MNTNAYSFAVCVFLALAAGVNAQTLNLFSVTQQARSTTSFFGGNPLPQITDEWSGAFNLGVTGTTTGSSSLPNPGLESSANGSLLANHFFSGTSWALSGDSMATFDAGLGNPGSVNPTISSSSLLSGEYFFTVDSPAQITLNATVMNQFLGLGPVLGFNGATVALYAVAIDGVFVDQYLVNWQSSLGSNGGTYSTTLSSGVFRLEAQTTSWAQSNVPDAFGTATSSYDLQLSVAPIPEPSGALLALLGGGWFLGLRRRRA